MFNYIKPYLPLIIPIISIPIIIKLIIAPIIFVRLKTKYIKKITSTIKEGWVDDRDLEAIEYLKKHSWEGLSTPFVITYDYNFLKGQIKKLFIDITKIYNKESKTEINLQFSLQKILESSFLLFEDLHKDLKELKVYNILQKLPISLFLRITKLNRSLKIITKVKLVQILQKYRISTKLLRFILIPIFGIPILITQLVFSLLYTTLFEGYLRFIYGLLIIKTGYYTIYLYSKRNSSLHNRLEFSHKKIVTNGQKIEERHTQFKNRFRYTKNLNRALETLSSELIKAKIIPNKESLQEVNRFKRVIKRVTNTLKNTIESELNRETKNPFDFKPLLNLATNIGNIYFPNSEQPIYNIRVKEFVELGYFLTTLALKNIYTIPGSKLLLDKIPLKFVFDITDFIDENNIKKYIPHIKKGGKIVKNLQSYYWATRVILKRSHPIIFISSMVTPLILQQIQDSTKEYIYNISGLLLIDSYETTLLRGKECRIDKILQKSGDNS